MRRRHSRVWHQVPENGGTAPEPPTAQPEGTAESAEDAEKVAEARPGEERPRRERMRHAAPERILATTLLLALAACHPDTSPAPVGDDPCASAGTWETVGQPFTLTWCTGCHSGALPAAERHGAPAGIDFDTLTSTRTNSAALIAQAIDGTAMPPGGGPGEAERERMRTWLTCGAPGTEAALPTADRDPALLGATTVDTEVTTDGTALVLTSTEPDGTRAWEERYLVTDTDAWLESVAAWDGDTLTSGTSWDPPLLLRGPTATTWSFDTVATDTVTGATTNEHWTATYDATIAADARSRDTAPAQLRLVEDGGEARLWQLSSGRAFVYRRVPGASIQQDAIGAMDFEGLPAFPLVDGLTWEDRIAFRAD